MSMSSTTQLPTTDNTYLSRIYISKHPSSAFHNIIKCLKHCYNKRHTCFFFSVEQRQIVNTQNENATNNSSHLIYKYLAIIWIKLLVSEYPVVLKCNLLVLYIYTDKLLYNINTLLHSKIVSSNFSQF